MHGLQSEIRATAPGNGSDRRAGVDTEQRRLAVNECAKEQVILAGPLEWQGDEPGAAATRSRARRLRTARAGSASLLRRQGWQHAEEREQDRQYSEGAGGSTGFGSHGAGR